MQTSLDTPKSKRRKLAQTLPNEGKKTVSSVKIGGAFASESPFHQRKKLCVNRDHDSNRNHFNSPPPLLPSNNKPSSSSSLKRKRNSSPSTRTRDRLIDSPLPSSLSKHQGKTSPSLKKKTILALQHRLNQAEQKQWTMGVFITTQRTKIQQQEATIELQSATIQEQSEQLHALVDKPPRENNTAPTSRTQTTTKKKTMKTPAKKKMTPAKKTTADSTTQPKKEKKKRQPAVVNSRAAALESAAPTPRTPATKKKTMKTPAKKKTTPAKKTTTDTTQPGTPSHSMVRRSMPPSRAKL